jgi:hypothetical protein
MLPNRARVYSSDRKEMGSVENIGGDYFVSMKRGIVMDEEYGIPVQAVEGVVPGNKDLIVEVCLSEEQLRHGYEIVEGKTGSDLVKGQVESELRLPAGKQLIRYNAVEYFQDARLARTKGALATGYSCNMCHAKFDNPGSLEKHRSKAHKGPVRS